MKSNRGKYMDTTTFEQFLQDYPNPKWQPPLANVGLILPRIRWFFRMIISSQDLNQNFVILEIISELFPRGTTKIWKLNIKH